MDEVSGKPVSGKDSSQEEKKYVWQTHLDSAAVAASEYHDNVRTELIDLIDHPPRVVLELGCSAGGTGAAIKVKFPGARVLGVELNQAAAEIASTRLDRVWIRDVESFDPGKEGVEFGEVDVLIAADVLEHLYSPWQVMERLKPFLSPDVQVIVSMPSTRNLGLMGKLAQGEWPYEASGLLDITHIRFFTYKEIKRFFYQLGYFVSKVLYGMDPALQALYTQYEHTCPADIDTGRLIIKNVSADELMELCSMQLFVAAHPLSEGDLIIRNELGDPVVPIAYDIWQKDRELKPSDLILYSQRMAQWQGRPRIHLALVVSQPDQQKIADTMWSLSAQHYAEVAISIIADFSLPQDVERGERLDWVQVSGGLLETVNRVLSHKPADWVGVIDAGDRVAAHGLLFFAEAMHVHPEWSLIYSDEDQLDGEGQRLLPHFKPDFNLDLLRSSSYIGGLALVRHELFAELGGFDPALLGAEEHDLYLKVYEKVGKSGIGHIPDVLYHRFQSGGHCSMPVGALVERGRLSVAGHLARAGTEAKVENGLFPGSYRVRYTLPGTPLVSILIRVQDRLADLRRTLESIMGQTRYPHYEIVIGDDGSASPDLLTFLQGLEAMREEKIRVLRLRGCGNLPAAHNRMAKESRGEFLVFWQVDCTAVQDDWLESLLAHAARTEAGLAGPRLLQADGTVLQGGAILGMTGQPTGEAFLGKPLDYPGYQGRAHLEQNFSALNGGCLVLRKSVFEEMDGFDAESFAPAHAEADFCLRLGAKGYSIVWTPFVNVMGNRSNEAELLPDVEDAAKTLFHERWLPRMARDPAYNVNLCLRGEGFIIETLQPLTWDPLPWRPLPRILVNPADQMGCGEYRIFSPARALNLAGKAQAIVCMELLFPAEVERIAPDAIVLQRQVYPEQIEAMRRYKQYSQAYRVFELDDLITGIPMKSVHRGSFLENVGDLLCQALSLCDRFVVSTEPMAEAYRKVHADIRVVPNYLERARWGDLVPRRRVSERPRVGWAGGIGHSGDLEVILDVVKALADEVDWIFFGLCPDAIRPYIKEFHRGVPVKEYPVKLASLNLDLALAPLECIQFNESKSHLKLLEYGILGYPVICTDIFPYQGGYPVRRVHNRQQEWVEAIREHVQDLDACARRGDELREYVRRHWMLEDNLDTWLKAWTGR